MFDCFKKKKYVYAPPKNVPTHLLAYVNLYRAKHNKQRLKPDHNLQTEANLRVAEIQHNFSHTGLNKKHLTNKGLRHIGECLAKGYNHMNQVMKAWDDSPEHKKVLLSKSKYIGIAEHNNYYVLITGR
jgi:uncharacterized protein YkwD